MSETHTTYTPAVQQGGLTPLWRSYTFLLVAINTAVFVAMCALDRSIFIPSDHILDLFGAKSTYGLFNREYWRLLTPMFIHIGVIHFAVNMLGLIFIGRHIESQIGGPWFFLVYLWTGFNGVLSSFLYTFGKSAGASGAIFGVVGCGFVFERFFARKLFKTRGIKLRRGPYTGLVIANIIIGFILTTGPVRIDNAAHLGGLFSGILLGFAFLYLHPNQFVSMNRRRAISICLALAVYQVAVVMLVLSPKFYREKIWYIQKHDFFSEQMRFEALTEAVKVFPEDETFFLERGKILALDGQLEPALQDFNVVLKHEDGAAKIRQFLQSLDEAGKNDLAEKIRSNLKPGAF